MASQIGMSNKMRPIQHPVRPGQSYTIGKGEVSRASRYAQLAAALTTLCALCIAVSACGGDSGPSKQAGGSATDTAKAYIASWEANDSASIDALLTQDAKSSWAMVGGPARWLSGKAESRGALIPGNGRILRLTESGGTAQADVGVVYDCKNLKGSTCPQDELPEWAPPGSSVSADHLTLERQADNRWLITYVDGSSYFAEAKQATQQAVAQLTQAAIPTDTPVPTSTPIPPTPTFTPTPVPVHTTAKAAYTKGGVGDSLSKWSNDAILFRVWDRTRDYTWSFDYDPSRYVIRPGLFTDVSEPYIDGDGTSRQWLFFAASTTRKEVMVVRVLDGKWDRQDVSASLYRDLFAAQGIVPKPVDIATALDSDEVVKIAREHGYRVQNLDDMYVQLGSEDRKSYSGYKPSEPNWAVFGEMGKAIVVKPDTGEIVQNDF